MITSIGLESKSKHKLCHLDYPLGLKVQSIDNPEIIGIITGASSQLTWGYVSGENVLYISYIISLNKPLLINEVAWTTYLLPGHQLVPLNLGAFL